MCIKGTITARFIRDQILLFVTTPTQRQHNLNSTSTEVGFDTKMTLQNPNAHPIHRTGQKPPGITRRTFIDQRMATRQQAAIFRENCRQFFIVSEVL